MYITCVEITYKKKMHIYIYATWNLAFNNLLRKYIRSRFNIFWTHWDRDKIADIFQTIFSSEFYWMKMFHLRLYFHWSCLVGGPLTILQHCLDGAKPLSEWMMVSLPTHICVTRAQWVNFGVCGSSSRLGWICLKWWYFVNRNKLPSDLFCCITTI